MVPTISLPILQSNGLFGTNFETNIERKRDIGQSLSTSVIQLTLDCFRLSDSGEDAKEKGTHEMLAGREKEKRLWVMGSRVFVLLYEIIATKVQTG